jgi:hypothetical protein
MYALPDHPKLVMLSILLHFPRLCFGEKSMNEEVKMSLQLVNGILQYLGTRPYGEVFQIVNAVHAEVQPQIPMPDMAKTDEAAKPVTDAA